MACKTIPKVEGHLNGFWDLFAMFCPMTIFIINFSTISKLPTSTFIFWFDFHPNIWEAFLSRLVEMSESPFGSLTSLTPHFLKRCKIHFSLNHYFGALSRELGSCGPNHYLFTFVQPLPFFIRNYETI